MTAFPVRGAAASQDRRSSGWMPSDGFYARRGKRMLDVGLCLAVMPVVLPLAVVLAGAVMLDGGAPFSVHERVGRSGRRFRILRLRSTRPDAAAIAAGDDPQVTRLGRMLRRVSLDELPLVWNVLAGDMSLVGPRPLLPGQRSLYPGLSYGRLRPGLTGFWQSAGRHRTTFAARADCDSAYESALSLTTDLRLLLRLPLAVLKGRLVRD